LEAAFVLTGETRLYNSASASYAGIVPANPFSLTGGGWGAWEIAGRFSTMDLNDQLAAANGIAGGRPTVYTLALNWYVNANVRFMFDYLHGDIAKQVSPTNFSDAGAKFRCVRYADADRVLGKPQAAAERAWTGGREILISPTQKPRHRPGACLLHG
jgi:phosphate-selective porin OprO/OprP